MKKILSIISALMIAAILTSGCDAPAAAGADPGPLEVPVVTVPGNMTFNAYGSITTLNQSCLMADAEVSWPLWSEVYRWATGDANMDGVTGAGETAKTYVISNPGQNGAGAMTEPAAPVTKVSWRDAIVWCNALTEYYNIRNKTTLDCVYYTDAACTIPLRTSTASTTITWEDGAGPNDGTQDDPFVKSSALGFRLPTNKEWVLAFRYREDADHDNDILDSGEFCPDDAVSGSNIPWNDFTTFNGIVLGKANTDYYAVYGQYKPSGLPWASTGVTQPASIRSKAPNALGIYDMSGNISEYVYDWQSNNPGAYRMSRGGNWKSRMDELVISTYGVPNPYLASISMGFRVARNAQ